MAIYVVTFKSGMTKRVNDAVSEMDAMRKAYLDFAQPIYCRIHDEIAARSSAPSGEMGLFFPFPTPAVSAQLMREVYMGGGYCIVPAE